MIETSQQQFIDSVFGIRDLADPSKLGQFDASAISADTARVLAFPNASGTIALEGWVDDNFLALDGEGTDVVNGTFNLTTTGLGTFGSLTTGGLTASRLLSTNASKILVSSDLYSWVTETSNQVLIADDGDGTITLSTPQDIHTGASPIFAGGTFTQVVAGIDPVASNHLATKEYVDSAISFINDFFLTDDASTGGYFDAAESPTGAAVGTLTTTDLTEGDGKALDGFITESGFPGVTTLMAGVYDVHFHVQRSAGNRDYEIYFELYTRTSGGAETLRVTSEISSNFDDNNENAIDIHATIATDVVISATDRLVWKLFANMGVGNNTNLGILTEGVTNSHVSLPTTTEILSSVFVRQDGTTELSANWGVGGFDITGIGALSSGAITSSGASTFNSGSVDADFTVNWNSGTGLFVQGSDGFVGIGTISPYSGLHYQGDILYLTPAAGAESNDNITIKNYATGNGAPGIILRTADIAGAYGIGVGTLSLIGGSKTTHYGGIGGGGGKISLQGGQGRDSANDPSHYAPVLLQPTGGKVGFGTDSPYSALHIKAGTPGTVGSHSAGQLIIQSPTDSVFANAVITAYESDGDGNPDQQLWYLGSSSGSNSHVTFLNRRNANLTLGTNGSTRMTILGNGKVGINTTTPVSQLSINGGLHVGGDSDAGDNNLLVDGTIGCGVITQSGTTLANTYQSLDAGLTSLAGLTYAAASFVKMTGADAFALRTIGETADDLEGTIVHDNLASVHQGVATGDSPTFAGLNLGTGELTAGSINRASGTLTLEIAGTPELSISTDLVAIANGLTVDTDTLVADAVNHRVGVGIASPTAKVHIVGDANTEQLIVKGNATQTDDLMQIQKSDGTVVARFDNVGRLGLGHSNPTRMIDIVKGAMQQFRLQSTEADMTNKFAYINMMHYDTSEVDFLFFFGGVSEIDNSVRFGGGSSSGNAATQLRFYTAATTTTRVGTERIRVTGTGNVGFSEIAPETLFEMTSTVPYVTLHNNTEENSDGGRESRINFKGEQDGTEETTLARIEVSHDGSADDEKGKFVISVNDGDDGNTPTDRFTIDAAGTIHLGDGTTNSTQISAIGDLLFVGSAGFYPRFLTQAGEPAAGTGATQLDTSEFCIWKDSDDSIVRLCFNDAGTVKTVALI